MTSRWHGQARKPLFSGGLRRVLHLCLGWRRCRLCVDRRRVGHLALQAGFAPIPHDRVEETEIVDGNSRRYTDAWVLHALYGRCANSDNGRMLSHALGIEMKPDYGIDAPGVRRGMLVAGAGGALLAGLATAIALWTSGAISTVAFVVAAGAGIAALYGFGMAVYMTYGSRVGKLRARERLLDLVHALAPWTGREDVLDVGCGRGLMLVGAARRLTTGKATGIDLWRAEDQTANTPNAALENARLEGVAERVSVETGDARDLPFPAASFDVVLSHWVVHNLPDAADRARALNEMLRVLRPGGVLVLADIAHHSEYREQLIARGLADMRTYTGGLEARVIGALSGGTFRPQAIVARRGL